MDIEERKKIATKLKEAANTNRGYASFFDWPDKDLKEANVCLLLIESMVKSGLEAPGKISPRGQGNDPPDCEIISPDGKVLGVEVTELVCEKAVKKYKATKIDDWADWDRPRLHKTLSDRVIEKDKAKIKGGPYESYYFIIYTDEPALQYENVVDLTRDWSPPQTRLIDRVYFLLSFDPRLSRCPFILFDCEKVTFGGP